jgi:DNA (cytosine-5)-methyltransferase 1
MTTKLSSIELFAGAGGLALGIEKAGFCTRSIVEWDKWACETLRENRSFYNKRSLNSFDIYHGDVRNYSYDCHQGQVDLVSGGPPCQPFSMGGKHKAYSDERDMFPQAVRAVRELCPKSFVFENVKGLTRASFSNYFEYIRLQLTYPDILQKADEDWDDHLSRLEQHHTSFRNETGLSYSVNIRVLNSANYGVPQKRERVFFVGFRADLDVQWTFPEETHSQSRLLETQQEGGEYWKRHRLNSSSRPTVILSKLHRTRAEQEQLKAPWKTVRDALSDLPSPYQVNEPEQVVSNHLFQAGAKSYPGHTGSPLDQPAKVLKAGVHGVPGGENMLRELDGSVRYFTVRESARLQTFPDRYRFHGSWSETMRQLGNAVPVELSRIVARSVFEALSHRLH